MFLITNYILVDIGPLCEMSPIHFEVNKSQVKVKAVNESVVPIEYCSLSNV